MILVSACLLGRKTKYNGGSNPHGLLVLYEACGRFLPVCPEALGGLVAPRPPAEINGGAGPEVLAGTAKVKNREGEDVTAAFIKGSEQVKNLIGEQKITAAILKENSPSCGVKAVYDGSFSGQKIKGQGVTAAVLAAAGVALYSECDLSPDLIERLINEDSLES